MKCRGQSLEQWEREAEKLPGGPGDDTIDEYQEMVEAQELEDYEDAKWFEEIDMEEM